MSWRWNQLSLPGYLNVQTGENTHDEEADSSVPNSSVERGDQHDCSDGGEKNGTNDVPDRILELSGRPAETENSEIAQEVAGGLQEVCDQLVVGHGVKL